MGTKKTHRKTQKLFSVIFSVFGFFFWLHSEYDGVVTATGDYNKNSNTVWVQTDGTINICRDVVKEEHCEGQGTVCIQKSITEFTPYRFCFWCYRLNYFHDVKLLCINGNIKDQMMMMRE